MLNRFKAAFGVICIFFCTIFAALSLNPNSQFKDPRFLEALKAGEREESFFENWSSEDKFEESYAVEMAKDPSEDFVILNLSDIQLFGFQSRNKGGRLAKATIQSLVDSTKPDLITVTGDNAWDSKAYLDFVDMMDSFDIPWAPVMGNHDGQFTPGEFWCAYLLANAENCLFKFGPKDMGYGNYIINITENGKIIHTLFMVDTHSKNSFKNEKGKTKRGYDHLWENQFQWYKWAVDGIADKAGKVVESTVFMHIPVYEYQTALDDAGYDYKKNIFTNPEYLSSATGQRREPVCCPPVNTGFFDLCKSSGSTKTMICGHDHTNYFTIDYQGITLAYSVKCGKGCSWAKDDNGGTEISINSSGKATVSQHFVNPDTLDY